MRILDWLKKKIKGSNSSSASKKIKEANRTSYYGGGVSTKATQTQVKKSAETARTNKQNEQKKEQEKKQAQVASAFKSSAFKSSVEKTKQIAQTKGAVEAQKPDPFNKKNAFKSTGLPQTTQQRLQAKMQSDINKKLNTSQSTSETKATPPTIKHRSTAMGTLGIEDTKKRIAKMNVEKIQQKERSRAADKLKPKIDEKYSTRKSGAPAYVKQGNYAADPDVAKYNVLKHPYATSGTRGALGTASLGLSDLAIAKLSKGEAKKAEEFYQANKSKGAELAGSLAGGVLAYGSTAGAFEKLGSNAVGRAATTELGKKLGAEKLAQVMAGTGAKATIARSLVGDAIQDSTMGLVDTMAGVAARDDLKTTGDYLKAIAKGQAANYAMGLAGNVAAHGLPVAGRAVGKRWDEFADESRRLYAVPPSVADVAEATMKDVNAKPTLKTVIANNLDNKTRKALIEESGDLDNEWWALRESIEQEYGAINPNYRELSPEQIADVRSKKTRMQEITARKNEIAEDLRIVRHVEEPRTSGASVDVPEKEGYNNVERGINNEAETGNIGRAQASRTTVSTVDRNVSRGTGADNKAVAGVTNASSDAGRRSGAGTLRISKENRAKLTESGVTDTRLSDVSNNYAAFSNALEDARKANAHGSWVDSQSVDDLAKSKAKTYLSDDGYAGVAVKEDGDICGVFKHPASKHRGASYDLIYTARANGGTKMDCYGQALVNRYEAVGYKPVAKIPFNAEYVSDPKLLEDAPDVYVLMKNTDDLDTVASRIKKSEQAGGYHRSTADELDKLPSFDDYDEALAYRDNLLKKQEAESTAKATSKAKKGKAAKGVEAEAKDTKAKSKTKASAAKSSGDSRYDDLVAERKRIMDDYFSKNESLDPTARKRIDEINEELKKLEPKKAGKKAKAETPKAESPKAEAKKAVKSSAKTEPSKAKAKSETKSKPEAKEKLKPLKDRIADADDFDEFVKVNAKNVETKEYVKANKKAGLKNLWHEQRIARHKGSLREVSVEEATDAVRKAIPENVRDGWFRDANSKYKPQLMDSLAKDPDAVNAGMNIAYRNYVDANPKKHLSFEEWLDTPQKMYRGSSGQKAIDEDVFSGFTPDRKVAEKFAGKTDDAVIEEITIKPRDTLGSYQTTAEQECLVPKSVLENTDIKTKELNTKAGTNKAAKQSAKTEDKTKATKTKPEKKAKATQETFDKDFAEFRKKVGNAKTDLYELENKLRVAETKEDKAAIRKQISALKKEVKTAYNKAGLRYHPDKGGSDAWMAKFNEEYDSFLNGGNGKPPKSQTQKPVRTVKNVEDIVNKSKEKVSSKEKVKDAIHSMKRAVSNSMTTFEERNLKSIKTDSEGWKVRNAAVDRHRRYNNLAVRSIDEAQLMSNGRRYGGTVERIGADGKTYTIQNGQSLKQIYEGMDKNTEAAFDAYLLLKHAPDRIREGTPIFDRINLDIGNGEPIKSLNDPKVVKAEAERLLKEHPEFAKKAEEIYQYTQNELENRVRAGLLSQETASKWMHDHPFYVPTGRDGYFNVVHGNHKGVIGADSLKAATGSDLDIRSIKEQLAEATSRNWRDITANDLLEKFFGDEVKAGRTASNGLELLNETVGLSKSADGRKFYAKIFRDGDMHRVEIDKNYYQDLADLYKNGRLGDNGGIGTVADTIADSTAKFSGTFKKLVTTWNPIFLPKNFSRDFQDALINTRQTKEFTECLAPAWKELGSDGEYARAFADSGVSQSNFVNLAEATGKNGKLGKAVDKFIALQDMTESFPRLAEYMATIKKAGYDLDTGLPKKVVDSIKKDFGYDLRKGVKDFKKGTKEIPANIVDAVKKMGYDATAGVDNVPTSVLDIAAANAADVTVNFGRSGSFGKNLNKGLIPFFNPSVQGWSKFLRNFSEQNSVKSTLGVIAKAGVLGAGVVTVNNFLLEDNPNYQQISARDKATNIIIPITWGKDVNADNTNLFVKIPRGRFAAVYGLPTVNWFNENDMGWAEMIKVARDQVLPVDPTESSLFAPLYAVSQNKTWYGAPIVPEGIENKTNPSQEYDANTSLLGRQLGKATEKLPTELQISPKKADYLIDAATGVAGDFALPMLTPSKQGSGSWGEKYILHPTKNVLKKAFTIDSTTQNNLSTRFYGKLQKATDNKDKEESKRLTGYSKEIGKINTAIRTLQNGNRKTKQEDIYGLQKVRNQMMQDAIDGKEVPSEYKAMDAVQKYVGTSYAINHFGTSADKEAMKVYGAAKYGDISNAEMRKAINADKDFYKGVQSIGKLQGKMKKAGVDSDTTLTRAVALASVNASDELFGAYKCTGKSRTETANEMERAKTYFNSGGSLGEYVKLEKCRRTLGKLSDFDKDEENRKNYDRLKRGEISEDEYYKKQGEIKYNANISYIGLSTSLAQANSPERGYRIYDIKDKNIQKGINLAAMGFTARDYRDMAKAVDTDGNGYPKKQEIIDFVSKSNVQDKATLYDVLYYYKGKYNPFGTPTKYTREQAAAEGKKKGVEWITDETDEVNVKEEAASGGGYYRRRWGRWHKWGHSGGGGSSKSQVKTGAFKPSAVHPSEGGSSATPPKTSVNVRSTANAGSSLRRANTKATLPTSTSPRAKGYASSSGGYGGSGSGRATTAHISTNVKRTQSRVSTSPKMNITPLNIKPVKASKATKGYNSNLSAALKDIENTQKKVAPPKARRK